MVRASSRDVSVETLNAGGSCKSSTAENRYFADEGDVEIVDASDRGGAGCCWGMAALILTDNEKGDEGRICRWLRSKSWRQFLGGPIPRNLMSILISLQEIGMPLWWHKKTEKGRLMHRDRMNWGSHNAWIRARGSPLANRNCDK